MRRVLLGVAAGLILVAAIAVSGDSPGKPAAGGALQVQEENRNPWSHLRLNNDPAEFRFAIVSDRTGGHRAKIFSRAVEQLNLLQPEFVLSVGDLIEGEIQDADLLAEQWREFQGYVSRLQMPFFYVPGNHDVGGLAEGKLWREKFGRSYYHFVYHQVLFLVLNSNDPPGKLVQLAPEQIADAKRILEANRDVRWTIVALHDPLWTKGALAKSGWLEIEKALADRPYTVFAGHIHRYQKFVRNGRNYYQLATTGGSSKMRGVRYGEFDHITWVTMKKDGPVLANILLDGVYPEDMRLPQSDEEGVPVYKRRKVYPVEGKIFFEGTPVPGGQVAFHLIDPATKRSAQQSDALLEADGSFVLTTYSARDGAPPGEYIVTIGNADPNLVHKRYQAPATSDLRATVKAEKNVVELELKK